MTHKYSDQGRVVERQGYDTQIITDAAIDFLRNRDPRKPFFLFVGYATTHNPWINRKDRLVSHYRHATFRDIPDDMPYACGVVDMALWDLVAKIEGMPLYRLLGERYRGGEVDEDVFVYAAGGYYYPGKDLSALQDEIKGYLDLGYSTVKIKIGGVALADDLKRIEAVIDVVGSGNRLAVDVNGRFDLKQALTYAEALEPYDLFWYEEPGDPLDYLLNAALAGSTSLPLATGENLFSTIDSTNLIRYGGMRPEKDFLQMDPALSYGLVEYLRTLDMLTDYGWSWRRCIPHGGHQFALHIAAGLGLFGNESYPHVFQPFGGFGDDIAVENGRIQSPQAPGIGFELKADLMKEFNTLF